MGDPARVLLDTHVVIWFMEGTLDLAAADIIIAAGRHGGALISPVSVWEIGLLTRPRGDRPPRLALRPDPKAWVDQLLRQTLFSSAPLTPEVAFAASHLPGDFHDDPPDRLLVATARASDLPLVTCDRRILAYAEAGHVRALAC